jgi:hypothetical protein
VVNDGAMHGARTDLAASLQRRSHVPQKRITPIDTIGRHDVRELKRSGGIGQTLPPLQSDPA